MAEPPTTETGTSPSRRRFRSSPKDGTRISLLSQFSWSSWPPDFWQSAGPSPADWRAAGSRTFTASFDEHFIAPFADHREGRHYEQACRDRNQSCRNRPGQEHGGVAARDQHCTSQILFHQRPEHKGEHQRRRLEIVFDQPIAKQAKERGNHHIGWRIVDRVHSDTAEHDDRREKKRI